jgi:hypothetical protein
MHEQKCSCHGAVVRPSAILSARAEYKIAAC